MPFGQTLFYGYFFKFLILNNLLSVEFLLLRTSELRRKTGCMSAVLIFVLCFEKSCCMFGSG